VRLFFVGQFLLSLGVFCESLLLLEDQAHSSENYFEDYFEDYFLARRRNRHRYALELMIPYR
jgi:hypothetical protein